MNAADFCNCCAKKGLELDENGFCAPCMTSLRTTAKEKYGSWREWERVFGELFKPAPSRR